MVVGVCTTIIPVAVRQLLLESNHKKVLILTLEFWVGGSISSNNIEQPFLELLPVSGVPVTLLNLTISGYSSTTVYLDFLNRTQTDNLHPFVVALSSSVISIANSIHFFRDLLTLTSEAGLTRLKVQWYCYRSIIHTPIRWKF